MTAWQEEKVSGRKNTLSTGIFLFAGYLLLKSLRDSFFQYQLIFQSTFVSPSKCLQQPSMCTRVTGKQRRWEWKGLAPGCWLSFWKPEKGWRHEKNGNMVQPPRTCTVPWWTWGTRDDWLNRWQTGKAKIPQLQVTVLLVASSLCFRGGCGMVVQNTPKWSVTFSLHLLGCINTVASLGLLLVSEGPQFLLSILEIAYGKVLHTLGVSFPPMVPLGDASFFANPVCFGWEWFSCTVESESKGWKDSRHLLLSLGSEVGMQACQRWAICPRGEWPWRLHQGRKQDKAFRQKVLPD